MDKTKLLYLGLLVGVVGLYLYFNKTQTPLNSSTMNTPSNTTPFNQNVINKMTDVYYHDWSGGGFKMTLQEFNTLLSQSFSKDAITKYVTQVSLRPEFSKSNTGMSSADFINGYTNALLKEIDVIKNQNK